MRIGIDIRPLQTIHRFRGIGSYTRNLLKHISREDADNEYVLFLEKGSDVPDLGFLDQRFRWSLYRIPSFRRSSVPARFLNQQVTTPSHIAKSRVDLFHFTEFNIPAWHPFRTVVMIHDLIPLRLRGKVKDYHNESFLLRKLAVKDDCHVLVNSLLTKHDVMELLGIPEKRISHIYLGIDERFRQWADKAAIGVVRKKYNLPEKFVLFVGSLEERKNVLGLAEAFERASGRHPDVCLVIVCLMSESYAQTIRKLRTLPLGSRIMLLDYLPQTEDLAGIYNAATCYASASLYEGFGLPLAEAMACGLPVACFDNSSHPEVVGDAGILVKNRDIDALGNAMDLLLTCGPLYDGLKAKALERAKLFSWAETARKTMEAYRKVCGGGSACV